MSRDWLESVWMQDAEIDLQGVEKAKEASAHYWTIRYIHTHLNALVIIRT